MSKIRILPEHEARKIAAGEVIERPASVVKELLENAIDAQATSIALVLMNGGKSRIEIRDNGCGMSIEDARLCIAHHATSKLDSVDQLTSISTFGFRGEALASIASVSKLQIITRRAEDEVGIHIIIEAGVMISEQAVGANVGTTIIVEDLFFNIPARKKFMKQRDTEWRAIHQLICATALAFPTLAFTATHDAQQLVVTRSCATMLERAEQLFGRETSPHLIALSSPVSTGSVGVTGVISNHQHSKYDRRHIFCFVNQRWVKNHILSKAIMAGYNNVLPAGKFPVAVLSITIPPAEVDVNIHPRKEEVMLLHPITVSTTIEQVVNKSLHAHIGDQFIPVTPIGHYASSSFASFESPRKRFEFLQESPLSLEPMVQTRMSSQDDTDDSWTLSRATSAAPFMPTFAQLSEQAEPVDESALVVQHDVVRDVELLSFNDDEYRSEINLPITTLPEYELIGQFATTYLLIEVHSGLLLVDQHAAHECVIYQRLLNNVGEHVVTKLLFPEFISLAAGDIERIIPYIGVLAQLGIEAEVWGNNQIMISATSTLLNTQSHNDIIMELLKKIDAVERVDLTANILHRLRALIACKSAVKAGDTLSADEQHGLIASYLQTENRLSCPHGRPTSWLLSHHEFERKFKRIGA